MFIHHFTARKIFGPFVSLPPAVQQSVVNVLYYFPGLTEEMLRALAACCAGFSNILVYLLTVVAPQLNGELSRSILQLVSRHYTCASQIMEFIAFLVSVLLSAVKSAEDNSDMILGKRKRKSDTVIAPCGIGLFTSSIFSLLQIG